MVSRDVRFNEGISAMEETTRTPIPEEPRIIHDSITVLPVPQKDGQLPSPPATEYQDSELASDPELSISSGGNKEPTPVDPSLLLLETEPA